MRITVFGLSVSSSWGNGHATLWRGLIRALDQLGHSITFFERDVPYYAENRDLHELPPPSRLVLYDDWTAALPLFRAAIRASDAVIITSYAPDGLAACALARELGAAPVVYLDMDTPVIIEALESGETLPFVGPRLFADYDLVLSYTGGEAPRILRERLGAQRVEVLYGHADPALYPRVNPQRETRFDLSYIGTYAANRQDAVETLFLAPARARADLRFALAGSLYPEEIEFSANIERLHHLPPPQHARFYADSRLTLNVTRGPMVRMGWGPPGRMFEAAASGVPLLTDAWAGLEDFFEPGREILVARTADEALDAITRPTSELNAIAERAFERLMGQHTSLHRARDLARWLEIAATARPAAQEAHL